MKNVGKVYDSGIVALRDINVDIQKGEFVFVVGPSGAGKTTFTKMIFREELPTQGQLVVNGRNVTALKSSEVPYFRRSLGIIFQDYRLLPNRTVYENVAFAMQVIEAPRREIQKRVNHVLELVGLRYRARNFPTELSGGEQQRVAIARAMAAKPALILADEPTGNLDPDTADHVFDVMVKALRDSNSAALIATHNMELANRMDRVVKLAEINR